MNPINLPRFLISGKKGKIVNFTLPNQCKQKFGFLPGIILKWAEENWMVVGMGEQRKFLWIKNSANEHLLELEGVNTPSDLRRL